MLEVVTRSDLGDLTEAWDRLLDQQPHATPHLRSWWLRSSAKGQPLFVLFVDQGRLIGGIPLELDRWRGLTRARVMASRSWPSGFDLIAESNRTVEVVDALGEWFLSSPIQLLDLAGVLGDARALSALSGSIHSEESGSAWVIDLPSNLDEYLSTKSRDFRRDLTRAGRRVADAGLTAQQVPPDQVERALATLKVLHEAQFRDGSKFLPFFPAFAESARQGVLRGEVLFYELADTAGQTVEIEVWLRLGGGVWGLVGGRHPDAVPGTGTVLRFWAMERFREQGISSVDLGGGYGYWKRSWATGRRTQLHVVAKRGLRAHLASSLTLNKRLAGVRKRMQSREPSRSSDSS
ncbi:MAG TPA: GNAT family N-acetyltransferase [Acidimicrobiia bacterium]|nr:GNAT family N-acetyltransferase [Acidimicrobiia bacterium]